MVFVDLTPSSDVSLSGVRDSRGVVCSTREVRDSIRAALRKSRDVAFLRRDGEGQSSSIAVAKGLLEKAWKMEKWRFGRVEL